jgi:hypothetical protein
MVMLVLSFFSWWYGRGWKHVASQLPHRLQTVATNFSFVQLLQTLFAPWRRIITYPGASLDEKLKAWGDNLFSRVIGFVVRIGVLLAGLLVLIITAVLWAGEIILWPLLPLLLPVCVVLGIAS